MQIECSKERGGKEIKAKETGKARKRQRKKHKEILEYVGCNT